MVLNKIITDEFSKYCTTTVFNLKIYFTKFMLYGIYDYKNPCCIVVMGLSNKNYLSKPLLLEYFSEIFNF